MTDNLPSDEFCAAFTDGGSISKDCACGRTHFESFEAANFEEGELERLLALAEAEPDKYVEHNATSVSGLDVFGSQLIYDCPCGGARKREDAIWRERRGLAKYLNAMIDRARKATAAMEKVMVEPPGPREACPEAETCKERRNFGCPPGPTKDCKHRATPDGKASE